MKVDVCVRIPKKAYLGGIAVLVQNYFRNEALFEERQVDISLFDYHDDFAERQKNTVIGNILYAFSFRNALKKRLKIRKPDIVHIHTPREFAFLRDVLAVKSLKKGQTKFALTIHVGAYETVFNRIPHFLHAYLIKCMNERFSKVFFLSESIRDEFEAHGLNPKLSVVLYNYYSLPLLPHEKRDGVLRVLYVGAIQREKGVVELLKAVETLYKTVPLRLDICGLVNDDGIKTFFEETVKKLGADTVRCHGYVSGEEKAKRFADADVLVLPSYHEGLPLVILEALAAGLGIVATRVGAVEEILHDERALYVKVGDAEGIADALKYLYNNPDALQAMQRRNAAYAENFSVEAHVDALCRIYHGIVRESGGCI